MINFHSDCNESYVDLDDLNNIISSTISKSLDEYKYILHADQEDASSGKKAFQEIIDLILDIKKYPIRVMLIDTNLVKITNTLMANQTMLHFLLDLTQKLKIKLYILTCYNNPYVNIELLTKAIEFGKDKYLENSLLPKDVRDSLIVNEGVLFDLLLANDWLITLILINVFYSLV